MNKISMIQDDHINQCNWGCFLGLGAHVIISSTLMIISAASLAEIKACSLDL